MDSQSIFIILNIIATVVVGIILKRQINSQNQIIANYKGYIESTDATRVIKLKEEEVEQIKKNLSLDINTLQRQVSEMSVFINHVFNTYQDMADDMNEPNLFDRDSVIFNIMPSCQQVLDSDNA